MEKLKPCPFCGSESTTISFDRSFLGRRRVFAECYKCHARGPARDIVVPNANKWATTSWNRRADSGKEE